MRDWLAVPVFAFLTCTTFSVPARAADPTPNACGCYHDDKGTCRCMKPAKCGCPGDCEPASCEAKRQAQADRENQAALRRIAERERKAAAEAKKQSKAAGKQGQQKDASSVRGNRAGADKGSEAPARGEIDDLLDSRGKAGSK